MENYDETKNHIEAILLEKRKLEQEISTHVSILVEKFKDKFGISPDSITIRMRDVSTFGDIFPDNIITKTDVSLDLRTL